MGWMQLITKEKYTTFCMSQKLFVYEAMKQ